MGVAAPSKDDPVVDADAAAAAPSSRVEGGARAPGGSSRSLQRA